MSSLCPLFSTRFLISAPLLPSLSDSRLDSDIPPSVVFLAAFHGFVFRLPSFQQLEAELTQPALQRWIGADRAFHDDVLRYSLSGFELEGLEKKS